GTRSARLDRLRFWMTRQRLAGPFLHQPEHGWWTALPGLTAEADGLSDQRRSCLQLYEDGIRLRPAHSSHDAVRKIGRGRFSHWQSQMLFSSSDNSDPNTNGRRYWWYRPDRPLFPPLRWLFRLVPGL